MNILVTGGAGYIGSHTCIELLKEGYEVIVIDNFINSSSVVIDRIQQISNKKIRFYAVDLLDEKKLNHVFESENIDCVIHFAALKAVGESVLKPLCYYENNISGSINLLKAMKKHNINKLIFSSSATVYGIPKQLPITEDMPVSVTNPYGRTKLMIEEILQDMYLSDNKWKFILLRYFNPIGAHKSGLIGENPKGTPNNLIPYISQVAIGNLEHVNIFGNDYDTHDGTGVRDYIHVVDIAKGHLKAVQNIDRMSQIKIYNLGTGKGYSVLDMIRAFEKVSGRKIKYQYQNRRAGDVAACYADVTKAEKEMAWKAQYGLYEMCADTWNWQQKNPKGYVAQ